MGGSLAGILGQGPMAQIQTQLQTQDQQQHNLSTSVPMPLQYQLDLSQSEKDDGQDNDDESLQGRESTNVIQGNTKFSVPIPVSAETPSPDSSTSHGCHGGMATANNLSEVKQNVDAST